MSSVSTKFPQFPSSSIPLQKNRAPPYATLLLDIKTISRS